MITIVAMIVTQSEFYKGLYLLRTVCTYLDFYIYVCMRACVYIQGILFIISTVIVSTLNFIY